MALRFTPEQIVQHSKERAELYSNPVDRKVNNSPSVQRMRNLQLVVGADPIIPMRGNGQLGYPSLQLGKGV